MKRKLIFLLAFLGFIAGLVAAYVYGVQQPPQPPVFTPASNPYARGLYAEGIVESDQPAGVNINIYPNVTGAVTSIAAREGQAVKAGEVLLTIDDSVQRATAAQLAAQAEAAAAMLDELESQPRKETLDVANAQVGAAAAGLRMAQDQFDKQQRAFAIEPKAVSKDTLDNAANTLKMARANLDVVTSQYRLTQAGAWIYDIRSQQKQVDALRKAAASADALVAQYTIRAPSDGVVLSVNAAAGSYVSPQGVYQPYTQGQAPVLVIGAPNGQLAVRCYVDEILIDRLPDPHALKARMSVRGTHIEAPLEFVRIQPYVSPKVELSDQRKERVDVRVLPVIFRVALPQGAHLYPGQLVDVYIAAG
ncbi:HlyD family secretion protein [Paraburkholderia graminis]|uniref:HlyD family secretion protein n=1 Tax=Paraburkholderia graminis TaxID=60548 RepID=A0ABD5CFM6_9BURK|nr:HlyD family efflux transporter periplasmic adaptor subunit [Paraburkholderia graminis]MDR6203901.1 HlyD family secretion protein [Paraburkholderia graminis]